MKFSESNLIWIDLEMTGLDPDVDCIIEIATIVTDESIEDMVEGPAIAIHQSDAVLARMDDWNTKHHGRSGLTQRVRDSAVSAAQAERETLEFLSAWAAPSVSPMCGNSICQDRRFLYKTMPKLAGFFHYRNLDVSTLKELCKRWSPRLPAFQKQSAHLALEDIRESIAELRHYRQFFLNLDA